MSKPHENNLNEELIELIEAVADTAVYLEWVKTNGIDGDTLEAYKEHSAAKKALYDYVEQL